MIEASRGRLGRKESRGRWAPPAHKESVVRKATKVIVVSREKGAFRASAASQA